MVILIGSTGYIGRYFARYFDSQSIKWTPISGRSFSLIDKARILQTFREAKATRVINCAGYTGKPNVDACELNKGICLDGNAVLPYALSEICADLGIPWGHVSSGCIFSGNRPDGGGWREDDTPNFSFRHPPCSFYSGTKALGEEVGGWQEVKTPKSDWPKWQHESTPAGYVWRLRIPFDECDNTRNYLSKVQSYETLLEARNSLSQLNDFVRASWSCFEKRIPFGIYNMTNPGSITTSEVVELIRERGIIDKTFKFFRNESEFMAKAGKTPRSNCVLDTSKIENAGIRLRPVREAIEWSLENWIPNASLAAT